MIDIRELRVGNYVHFNNELREVERLILIKVDNLSFQHISLDYRNRVKSYIQAKSATPIELSEKWLIAFKLSQDFDRFYFKAHGNDYSVRISKTGGRLYGCGNNAIPIYHVHQLQNIYFDFTGEELTIKDYGSLFQ